MIKLVSYDPHIEFFFLNTKIFLVLINFLWNKRDERKQITWADELEKLTNISDGHSIYVQFIHKILNNFHWLYAVYAVQKHVFLHIVFYSYRAIAFHIHTLDSTPDSLFNCTHSLIYIYMLLYFSFNIII